MTIHSQTPRETVEKLDNYIVGQSEAKRSVAIALRNRWRRRQVEPPLREEIAPKNIIMIGPTGVGKTEIARRLASLAQSPFLKVEASKFTEVGYVGRDVESMIRDLMELAINMVKREEKARLEGLAEASAEDKLLDLLLPPGPSPEDFSVASVDLEKGDEKELEQTEELVAASQKLENSTREKFRRMLREGRLDHREVELSVQESHSMPIVEVMTTSGMEEMQSNLQDAFSKIFPKKNKTRKMKIPDAFETLTKEELENLVDMDKVVKTALQRTMETGIIFLDEIDKIATRGGSSNSGGPEVSREGVQRDLLPIVEGATVATKYGMIQTDHILFIASGAFHFAKPSDLIPELQGRFPIRVELNSLGKEEFVRILTEPENALVKQYVALMATEGIELRFEDGAIEEIASLAVEVNEKTEEIGARRLHTIMERVLDELSFDASERDGGEFVVTAEYVRQQLAGVVEDQDLSRFIL